MRLLPLPRVAVACLCTALLATGGLGWAESRRTAAAHGTNILVVGVDTRAGLSRETTQEMRVGRNGCGCTDVMMLVHLAADGSRASVVSLPRDSYVTFAAHRDGAGRGPGRTHPGKINAAYRHGGRKLAVRTVEKATGVRVDHYLQADFTGFVRAVDDLGGATVCTRERMADKYTGIDLAPGTHRLDGLGALRYVRTRHLGGFGDISRVRRQQRLVADVVHQAAASGRLSDGHRRRALVRKLLGSIRADDRTRTRDLLRLGYAARNLSVSDVEFATVPLGDIFHWDRHWGATVTWHKPRARELFDAMRRDEPLRPADDRKPPGGDWIGRVVPGKQLLCPPGSGRQTALRPVVRPQEGEGNPS